MGKKGSKQGEGLLLWLEQQTNQMSVSDQDCFGEWGGEAERRCWQPLTVSPLVVPLYRVSPALLSFHSLFLCVTQDHTTQLAAARAKNWTSKGSCWMDRKRLAIMYFFPPSAALTCHVFSIWKARGRSGFLIAASFPVVKEKIEAKGLNLDLLNFYSETRPFCMCRGQCICLVVFVPLQIEARRDALMLIDGF